MRKPHAENAGYVCELKAKLGGHIVVYDRSRGFECDADHRWIVMHEPSSLHVAVRTMLDARAIMKAIAKARTIAEANEYAQIIPQLGGNALEADDEGAAETVLREKRLARRQAKPAPQPSAVYEWKGETLALVEEKGHTCRSLIGNDVVHFTLARKAICGADLDNGFDRYPDQHPAKLFRVCGKCASAITGSPS